MKNITVIKRITALLLAIIMLFTDVATTVSYAQDIPTETATAKFTTLATDTVPAPQTILDGQGMSIDSLVPAFGDSRSSFGEAGLTETAMVRKLAKENYRPNEDVEVVIENGVNKEYKTELIDAIGNNVAIEMDTVDTGATKVITLEQPSAFKPGKYTLRISDTQGGVSEQDFSWGVLAINTDKTVYAPNETANLAFGVLDEGGNMVCDAQVELTIKTPKDMTEILSTDNGKIKVNPECESHDFTLNPDYSASYTVAGAGVYKMELKAQTRNGQFSITDSFEVRQTVPFDVKRITATRIYPPHQYPVTMEITANQDFEGTITETVPASFKISRPGEVVKNDKDKVDAEVAKQVEDTKEAEKENENIASSTVIPSKDGIQGQNVDPGSESGMTENTQSAVKQSAPLAPDNLPNTFVPGESGILAYSTINDLQQNSGVKAVLGASVPGLGMPFAGNFPVSQEFGESLVTDLHDHDLYSSFGMSGHDGIDFGVPVGTPLLAVDNGKVLLAGDGDYGTTIVIQHAWGRSYYGHLSAVSVKDGDTVTRGQTIGNSGNTGISTGPHLHFGIKPDSHDSENGYYGKVDPAYYLGMKQSAANVLGVATSAAGDEDSPSAMNFPETPDTDVKILTWKAKIKKGDKITIGYNYLAPRISPQFYTLGPATFTDTTGREVFHETRKWQIAADALEYKMKQGSFAKSTCNAVCTQVVGGVGFKPKAIIFEWTQQVNPGESTNMNMGTGFVTVRNGVVQERSMTACSEDGVATSDTSKRRSSTKAIVFQTNDCASSSVFAEADFVSFDNDGFTLSWTTNNFGPYVINYTAIGGSDVSDAKVGSFTLSSSGATQSFTDPGFQPDFVMFLANGGGITDTLSNTASMSAGFAASPTKEGAIAMLARHNQATSDTYSQQSTTDSILLLTSTGTQDATADLASFDSSGFTLNVTNTPAQSLPIYYLALQGGQYDVGSIAQPTTNGSQSVYTGFKPSGFMVASASTSATRAIGANAAFSLGGASRNNASTDPWCNDSLDITCTGPGVQTISNTTPSDWCADTTGVTCGADWSTRKKITFSNASNSGSLTNFPVLVKLDSTRIDYTKVQDDGDDLRFVDPNDKTVVLSHEIESWNEFGTSYVWVEVPSLDAVSGADFIWMYYGNGTASSGQDATGTWDNGYESSWHFDEGTSTTAGDATSKANNLTLNSAGWTANGKIGYAWDGNGSRWLSRADDDDFDFAGSDHFTISYWFRSDGTSNPSATEYLINKGSTVGYAMDIWNDGGVCMGIDDDATGFPEDQVCSPVNEMDYYDGNWHHVVATKNGTSTMAIYVDNIFQENEAVIDAVGTLANAGTLYLGDGDGVADAATFDGDLDQFTISRTSRSVGWIQAEYLSGNDKLNSFGPEEFNNAWCADTSGITCSSDWDTRKKITFDDTAASSGAQLKDFPVLVKLNSSRIDYSKTKSAGEDIRFVDPGDPTTVLSHEIESWNESGDSYVWVKVPQLDPASGADFVWMYYNNSSASDGQDAQNVWDSNFEGVWHMKESPASTCAASDEVCDSTSNNLDADANNMEAADQKTGQINGNLDFDGSNEYLSADDNALYDVNTFTISAWTRLDTLPSVKGEDAHIAIKKHNSSPWFASLLAIDNANDRVFGGWNNTVPDGDYTLSSTALTTGKWYYVTYVKEGNFGRIYLNATNDTSFSDTHSGTTYLSNGDFHIGADNGAQGRLDGQIDDVRFSSTARSVDWIRAEYVNGTDRMNTFGPEQNFGEKTAEPAGWAYRKKISFNASSSAELKDFPMLVKLNTSRIDYNKTQNSGQDIRFVDPTNPGKVLPHEIESWNENGDSFVWVKVPQIDATPGGDYIWMYYGNRFAPDGQTITGVWDSSYRGVWHNNETSGNIEDSTANNNNATATSVSTQGTATGRVNGAHDFNNAANNITIPDNSSLDLQDAFTIGLWANPDTIVGFGDYDCMISSVNYYLCVTDSNEIEGGFFLDDDTGSTNSALSSTNAVAVDTMAYFEMTFENATNTITVYRNGVRVALNTSATGMPGTVDDAGLVWDGSLRFGNNPGGAEEFDGILDEVRISAGIRSPGWRLMEYQSMTDSVNVFGAEETPDGTSNSYSQGNIWTDDADNAGTINANMSTSTTKVFRAAASHIDGTAPRTKSEAEVQSIDSTGFTLNWTTTDSTARQVIYWAAGSVTASQDDYRWYKNTNSITPDTALEDENSHTIIPKNKPYARLRANMSVGGNGLNALSQGYKLQYAAAGAVAGSASVNDWCNDTTGVTCTAPQEPGSEIQASIPTDWCNDTTGVMCTGEWSSRRSITFNNASSSADLTNFPVLIKLDAKRIDYSKTQANGEDIRFVDPDDPTTVLPHEIEDWNESGTSYVWVKVNQIDKRSINDSIWMYYGNSTVSDGQAETSVWDSSFAAVYHHAEDDPSVSTCPTNKEICDSTTNANNADSTALAAADVTTGQVDGAFDFDGSTEFATAPDHASLDITGNITLSAWIRPDSVVAWQEVVAKDGAGTNSNYGFQIDPTVSRMNFYFTNPTNNFIQQTGNTTLSPSTWYHVTVSYDTNTVRFYLNGKPDGTTSRTTALQTNTGTLKIGTNVNSEEFDGIIDEVRVSSTIRSADWVQAEYLNATDQFNTYGTEFTQAEVKQSSTGWQYRKKITFNNASSSASLTTSGASESGNLVDFPVLVKLDSSRIDYTKTQNDGDDIRFVDPSDSSTVLPHEIETWSEASTSAVWVKVPQIDANSTTDFIWMYYGNPGVSDGQNASGVWDNHYRNVYHMEGSTGSSTVPDSATGNSAENGTKESGTGAGSPSNTTSGKIGEAQDFTAPDYVQVSGLAGNPNQVTLEAWVQVDALDSGGSEMVSIGDYVGLRIGAVSFDSFYHRGGGNWNGATADVTLLNRGWRHVMMTVGDGGSGRIKSYVDGVLVDDETYTEPISWDAGGGANTEIGRHGNGDVNDDFDGRMDEVRISTIARSAQWAQATYLSSNDQFNSFSDELPYTTSSANQTAGWIDVADPWCSDVSGITCGNDWNYRKKISFNTLNATGSALTNFPVLVKLDPSRIDYTKVQDNGNDLRFVDPSDPTVVLDHEIETWNEQGVSTVWVEVPSLQSNSITDAIWMYYGNGSATSGENASSVWDADYVTVMHLKESGNGTANEYNDSSTTNNDGRGGNGTAANVPQRVAGKVGYGQDFDGSNDYINMPNNTAVISATGTYSIEFWMNPDDCAEVDINDSSNPFTKAGVFDIYLCGSLGDNNIGLFMSSGGATANTYNNIYTMGNWYHVVMTYSGGSTGTVAVYINGVMVAMEDSLIDAVNAAGQLALGTDTVGASSYNFQGMMDEVRVSDIVRSSDWIEAEYMSTSDQMNTFGAEETQTTYAWKFKDNSAVGNGATITSSKLGTSATGNQMSYLESNLPLMIPTALAVGERREWDFSLDGSNTSNRRTYYFRIVSADGEPLTNYTRYPSITVGVPNQKVMRGGKFFNYKQAQPFTF